MENQNSALAMEVKRLLDLIPAEMLSGESADLAREIRKRLIVPLGDIDLSNNSQPNACVGFLVELNNGEWGVYVDAAVSKTDGTPKNRVLNFSQRKMFLYANDGEIRFDLPRAFDSYGNVLMASGEEKRGEETHPADQSSDLNNHHETEHDPAFSEPDGQ